MRLVSLGCNVAEIAAILGISPKTVDGHRVSAMKVLGADRAAILTRLAIKYKISPLDDKLTRTELRKSGR
jgi:DNA-binding CsgD family transcriptional regulator